MVSKGTIVQIASKRASLETWFRYTAQSNTVHEVTDYYSTYSIDCTVVDCVEWWITRCAECTA
jgi:hypothetical protein